MDSTQAAPPPRSSGLCCRVWRTTSDPLRPFLRDPESRARNRGTRRPTCGDGRDSPGLRAARSAHFSGRAAWWGLRNPSPTPPAHFGHNVGGGSSGTQSARKYRPFNLRGTARGPPTGSDVRAPLRDAAPLPAASPSTVLGACDCGQPPCDSERGCPPQPPAAFGRGAGSWS